jgi:hypothetical protein
MKRSVACTYLEFLDQGLYGSLAEGLTFTPLPRNKDYGTLYPGHNKRKFFFFFFSDDFSNGLFYNFFERKPLIFKTENIFTQMSIGKTVPAIFTVSQNYVG